MVERKKKPVSDAVVLPEDDREGVTVVATQRADLFEEARRSDRHPSPQTSSEDQDETRVWAPEASVTIATDASSEAPARDQPARKESTAKTRLRRRAPDEHLTTVFCVGMLVGFLVAVALGLGLLLFLVSTGRADLSGS